MLCVECEIEVDALLNINNQKYCFNCVKKNHMDDLRSGGYWQQCIKEMGYYKKPFDLRFREAVLEDIKKDIDMESIKSGLLRETHPRLYKRFRERIDEIQSYIAANVYYNRDIQDERYKYNYLRTRLIEQRARQEDRTNSEGI